MSVPIAVVGCDVEDQDQQRRHQRAAAHPGHADEHADAETEEDDCRVDVVVRTVVLSTFLTFRSGVRSAPGYQDARARPGSFRRRRNRGVPAAGAAVSLAGLGYAFGDLRTLDGLDLEVGPTG